jgi:hypothetical protein
LLYCRNPEPERIDKGVARPKDETAEEKRERKKQIKEERKVRMNIVRFSFRDVHSVFFFFLLHPTDQSCSKEDIEECVQIGREWPEECCQCKSNDLQVHFEIVMAY